MEFLSADGYIHFYSRASCEARPLSTTEALEAAISTHAPRVRRDAIKNRDLYDLVISTHAPRVRRDITAQ